MAVENISQKSYSYRYLGGAIVLGFLEALVYQNYTTIDQTAIFSFIGNAITFVLMIAIGIPCLVCIYRFCRYFTMSHAEWQEFAKHRRAFLSVAIYKHPHTGDTQTVRRGFSVPVFLFGIFAPIFKGQWELAIKFFVIIFFVQIISSVIPVIGNILGYIFTNFGLARKYNRYYENWLINQGYQLVEANKFTENIKQVNSQIKYLN